MFCFFSGPLVSRPWSIPTSRVYTRDRFLGRWTWNTDSDDFAHSSPNFIQSQKVPNLASIFDTSHAPFETEQRSWRLKQNRRERQRLASVLSKFRGVRSTHPWENGATIRPLKNWRELFLNHQHIGRGLSDFAEIWWLLRAWLKSRKTGRCGINASLYELPPSLL